MHTLQTGEGAEPEGKVHDLAVNLYGYPHSWSWVVKRWDGRVAGRIGPAQNGLTSGQIAQGVGSLSHWACKSGAPQSIRTTVTTAFLFYDIKTTNQIRLCQGATREQMAIAKLQCSWEACKKFHSISNSKCVKKLRDSGYWLCWFVLQVNCSNFNRATLATRRHK